MSCNSPREEGTQAGSRLLGSLQAWTGYNALTSYATLMSIGYFRHHADILLQAYTTADIQHAKQKGKKGTVLGFQNAAVFEGNLA